MKNKGILSMVLSIIVSVLLVFSIIGTCALCFACTVAQSPEYLTKRLSLSGTYDSVYSDLMKKYDEMSYQTSVPADVYKSAVSEEWVFSAVKNQVEYSYSLLDDANAVKVTDFGAFEEKITEYFEKYAAENHVLKDDTYKQRLASCIENAVAVTDSVTDVYHFETIRKTSLWPAAVKYRSKLGTLRLAAFIADAVLILLLAVFRNPLYWTGASLFASGALMTIPSAYVLGSGMIMKFTIKDYTVFTLITDTLKAVANTVLTEGVVLLIAGVVIIGLSMLFNKSKKEAK